MEVLPRKHRRGCFKSQPLSSDKQLNQSSYLLKFYLYLHTNDKSKILLRLLDRGIKNFKFLSTEDKNKLLFVNTILFSNYEDRGFYKYYELLFYLYSNLEDINTFMEKVIHP